jgi:hypothetical protein
MDDRIRLEFTPQPGIKGEIAMRRNQVGIVIGRLRVNVVAARGLDAHDDVAEAMDGEMERALREEGIAFRRPPAGGQSMTDGERQSVEE